SARTGPCERRSLRPACSGSSHNPESLGASGPPHRGKHPIQNHRGANALAKHLIQLARDFFGRDEVLDRPCDPEVSGARFVILHRTSTSDPMASSSLVNSVE